LFPYVIILVSMKNIPTDISKYIIEEIMPYHGLFILKTNSDMQIEEWLGPSEKFVKEKPVQGELLSDYLPELIGIDPPIGEALVLSKIETNKDNISDIHIINFEKKGIWILITDAKIDADLMRRFIQGQNEEALKKENKIPESQTFSFPFGSIDLLDYIVFERFPEDTFSLRGDIPPWFTKLYPDINLKTRFNILGDYLPFLEYFNVESKKVWENRTEKKIVSVPWSDYNQQDEEIFLQAIALRANSINYLLLKKLDRDYALRQDIMQKARELKLTYEKLEKAEKELKRLLKFKDQFVSIVSHDLRSPMASVLGIAEMFLEDEELLEKFDDFHQEMLIAIRDQITRVLDYNTKLYHWSNLELGNFKISKKKVELRTLTDEVKSVFIKGIEEKNIKYIEDIPDDLLISVDATLFSQALNNLVGNALKFTPENGHIRIYTRSINNDIQIIVEDSGVGIPQDKIDSMFMGFNRDSTHGTKGEKGSGLGLGIVKQIIDTHGFSIKIESEVNKGTKFIINII